MAALLGVDLALAQTIADAAAQGEVCTVANDNDPGQVVISGSKAAIDRAIAMAKDMGAKRAVPLPVSAPFHCPLMQPAAEAMRDALSYVVVEQPRGAAVRQRHRRSRSSDPDTIRTQLVEQVTGMVRWRESVAAMGEAGVDAVRRARRQGARPDGQAHRCPTRRSPASSPSTTSKRWRRRSHDVRPLGMTALVTGASGGLGQRDRQGAGGAGRSARGLR